MKFYRTDEFQRLQRIWEEKLKDSKFKDIEDSKGNLKQYDRRTIAFDNRDHIYEFFCRLDAFLCQNQLPWRHRAILMRYSRGQYLKEISESVGRGQRTVQKVIELYKEIILVAWVPEIHTDSSNELEGSHGLRMED